MLAKFIIAKKQPLKFIYEAYKLERRTYYT
jgi:hypothetical protein